MCFPLECVCRGDQKARVKQLVAGSNPVAGSNGSHGCNGSGCDGRTPGSWTSSHPRWSLCSFRAHGAVGTCQVTWKITKGKLCAERKYWKHRFFMRTQTRCIHTDKNTPTYTQIHTHTQTHKHTQPTWGSSITFGSRHSSWSRISWIRKHGIHPVMDYSLCCHHKSNGSPFTTHTHAQKVWGLAHSVLRTDPRLRRCVQVSYLLIQGLPWQKLPEPLAHLGGLGVRWDLVTQQGFHKKCGIIQPLNRRLFWHTYCKRRHTLVKLLIFFVMCMIKGVSRVTRPIHLFDLNMDTTIHSIKQSDDKYTWWELFPPPIRLSLLANLLKLSIACVTGGCCSFVSHERLYVPQPVYGHIKYESGP